MARILIVEDDANIAKLISASLSIAGHDSLVCQRGDTVLDLLQHERFDLILLDVMLPGMHGFDIMQRIRGREIPVIFLSAREAVADRVNGLRLGAEDYMVKPFEPVELLARIDVVLRRTGRLHTSLQYDDLDINISERVVRQSGRPVDLTPKEFDLLVLLVRNLDIALSREKMLSVVWGYSYEGETRTVDIHIQQLRKKLNLRDRLKTVAKVGYRLES